MPKYNDNDDEVTTKNNTFMDGDLFYNKEQNKTSSPTPKSNKFFRKEKELEEKEKVERERFESLFYLFMSYWNDRSTKHPGILYHLSRTEAFVGFELYHNDAKKFHKWSSSKTKARVGPRAPYPYNLPPLR